MCVLRVQCGEYWGQSTSTWPSQSLVCKEKKKGKRLLLLPCRTSCADDILVGCECSVLMRWDVQAWSVAVVTLETLLDGPCRVLLVFRVDWCGEREKKKQSVRSQAAFPESSDRNKLFPSGRKG